MRDVTAEQVALVYEPQTTDAENDALVASLSSIFAHLEKYWPKIQESRTC